MEVNKSEDRSGTFDYQNTGEHTPCNYPRTESERNGGLGEEGKYSDSNPYEDNASGQGEQ